MQPDPQSTTSPTQPLTPVLFGAAKQPPPGVAPAPPTGAAPAPKPQWARPPIGVPPPFAAGAPAAIPPPSPTAIVDEYGAVTNPIAPPQVQTSRPPIGAGSSPASSTRAPAVTGGQPPSPVIRSSGAGAPVQPSPPSQPRVTSTPASSTQPQPGRLSVRQLKSQFNNMPVRTPDEVYKGGHMKRASMSEVSSHADSSSPHASVPPSVIPQMIVPPVGSATPPPGSNSGRAPRTSGEIQDFTVVATERDCLRAEVEVLKKQLEDTKESFEMVKKSSKDLTAKHNAEIAALKEKAQSMQDQLQSALEPLKEENKSLQQQVTELKNTSAKLQQEKDLIESILKKIRESLQLALDSQAAAEKEAAACRQMITHLLQEKEIIQKQLVEQISQVFVVSNVATQDIREKLSLEQLSENTSKLKEQAAGVESDLKELDGQLSKFQEADESTLDIPAQIEKWRVQYTVLCSSGLDPFCEPYCFDVPDAPTNIKWSGPSADGGSEPAQVPAGAGGRTLQYATLNKLIEVVTSPTLLDSELVAQFLLTYRTFTTPQTLIKKFAVRYRISDANATPDIQTLVRVRVVDIVCKWMERFPKDFADDEMKKLVRLFAAGIIRSSKTTLLFKLVNAPVTSVQLFSAPAPVASSGTKENTLILDVQPIDIAKQIALLDQETFARIEPQELLSPNNWMKPEESTTPAVNVTAMTARFNRITDWIQCEILKRDDFKERAKVMAHVLKVGKECLTLNDFHAVVAIGYALQTSAIERLHQTQDYMQKKLLSKKEKSFLQELQALLDSNGNRKVLRAATDSAVLPGVPYMGMFLSDIFFIAEGNKDYVKVEGVSDDGLINFAKKRMTASVIQRIQTFQRVPYRHEVDNAIRAWLNSPLAIDPESFFERSKQLENTNPN